MKRWTTSMSAATSRSAMQRLRWTQSSPPPGRRKQASNCGCGPTVPDSISDNLMIGRQRSCRSTKQFQTTMNAAQFPVILTYHSISEGDSPLQIAPSLFAEHMEWLHANVRVAPLAEVVSALTGHQPLPERTVVLTFDDGFADFYSSAAPVLRKLKLPATLFVLTGLCGQASDGPAQETAGIMRRPLLDW